MVKMKEICFDLDGVICNQTIGDYENAVPDKKAIEVINKLYNQGNKIIIFTSRFMGRNQNNVEKTYSQGYEFTLKQLKEWKVKFHKLIMGKPRYDIIIDDKAVFFKKDWKEISKQLEKNSKKSE